MTKILLHLFTVLVANSMFAQELYDSIPKAQYEALNSTPYKNFTWAASYVQYQIPFRERKFPPLIKNILKGNSTMSDTLWILEEFDDECTDCSSFRTELLYKDTLYIIEQPIGSSAENQTAKFPFSSNLSNERFRIRHHEFFEVKYRISKKKEWTNDTLKYGSDGCADGSHSLMTLIAPNRVTKSVYVRCWSDWYGKSID